MKKIKHIVIVGGGSSGWVAAAYLNWNFPQYKITIRHDVIDAPENGTHNVKGTHHVHG